MNLIIEADLINPPTLLGSFRDFTFFASRFYPNYDVLLRCQKEEVDLYYRFLKNYVGGLDFVKDFIFDPESGLYVDHHYADRITPETLPSLLMKIGFKFRK